VLNCWCWWWSHTPIAIWTSGAKWFRCRWWFSASGFKSHLQKELHCQNLAESQEQILVVVFNSINNLFMLLTTNWKKQPDKFKVLFVEFFSSFWMKKNKTLKTTIS
jgi:hypothetical protein